MSQHTAESENSAPSWDNEQGIKKIADFLRGRKGMPVRHAVEMGKRIEYFKGDKLITFLIQNSEASKHCPTLKNKDDILKVGRELVLNGYIHRSERDPKNKKILTPCKNHSFMGDGYYTWMYDGPKTLRHFLTAALIIGFFCCTCFPIWPMWAKVGLWYVSVTLLIFITIFSILRLIAFFLCWLAGYDFWFLPNVFDDNLGVIESFRPTYSFKATGDGERYYRVAAAGAFIAFCFWVANQPTDFDEYMEMSKQFTDDIYSGKLLDDISQHQKENIDKFKVPNLEEFMREEEEPEREENQDFLTEPDEEKIFDKFMEDKYFSDGNEGEDADTQDDDDYTE